jgi:hypothetical protein
MPSVRDDGSVVTLDLHGATVEEALDITYRTLYLAEERGRQKVKLIHGSSTSRGGSDRRTIKRELAALVDQGSLGAHATSTMKSRDYIVLALDVTVPSDPTRIQPQDVLW